MKRFASKYFEILNELVDDKQEIVTFKKLSSIGKISVNEAKKVLDEFASNREDLNVIYTLIGSANQDEEVIKIKFCKESLLENVKKSFSKITSCHVYSISKTQYLNSGMLYSDEKLDRKLLKICLDDGEVVREPNVSSSTLIENKSEMKSIKQERIAEKKELMIEKKSKQMTEKNEKEKIPEKSKVNTFNNDTENKIGKVSQHSTKPSEKKKVSEDFFKTSTNSKKSNQTGKKTENKTEAESPANDDILPKKATRRSFQDSSEDNDSKNKDKKKDISKRQEKKDEKKRDGVGAKKKAKDESNTSAGKRRKRIAVESSSEEEELEKPQEKAEESTQASITELSQPGSGKRRKRVRKAVTKTFVNDEGYMVTEKVYESASTDASEDELKKSEIKKPVETVKPKKKGRKVAENQSTLTSFFKRQ